MASIALDPGELTGPSAGKAADLPPLGQVLCFNTFRPYTRRMNEAGAGVFGVPTVLVGEDLFWGDDRLALAAEALRV